MFERLWQADKPRSQLSSGVGLELAIAQDIASRHGGEISVQSEVGAGSNFSVRLPAIAENKIGAVG